MTSDSDNNVVWHKPTVDHKQREARNGHKAAVIWFTGLSGSGKSTLAHHVEKKLFELGCQTYVFDGDNVRHGLCADLDFTEKDRSENIRRISEMIKLFFDAGLISLTAFISPYKKDRDRVRSMFNENLFFEIYCRCDLETCEQRDVKGLYKKARAGEIANYTGISSPYEEPVNAELVLDTARHDIDECVDAIIKALKDKKIIHYEQ